jgi:hypothetical protein
LKAEDYIFLPKASIHRMAVVLAVAVAAAVTFMSIFRLEMAW